MATSCNFGVGLSIDRRAYDSRNVLAQAAQSRLSISGMYERLRFIDNRKFRSAMLCDCAPFSLVNSPLSSKVKISFPVWSHCIGNTTIAWRLRYVANSSWPIESGTASQRPFPCLALTMSKSKSQACWLGPKGIFQAVWECYTPLQKSWESSIRRICFAEFV